MAELEKKILARGTHVYLFFYLIFIVFFPLPSSPIKPPCHTAVHVPEYFCSIPPFPNTLLHKLSSVLHLSLSLFCLLVQFVH